MDTGPNPIDAILEAGKTSRPNREKTDINHDLAEEQPGGTAPPTSREVRRTTNRRGVRTRDEIVDAASRLMAERGYTATSLSTLSEETGLRKGSIHHHFGSKAGVLSAVMAKGAREFFDAMVAAQGNPPDGTPRERLTWFLRRTSDAFAPHEPFLRLFLHLTLSNEAALNDEIAQIMDDVRTEGRRHMSRMIEAAFHASGKDVAAAIGDELSYLGISGFDGAFIGTQAEEGPSLRTRMDLLAEAIALVGEAHAAALTAPTRTKRRPRSVST